MGSNEIYLKFCNRTSRKLDLISSFSSKIATLDPGNFCYVHTQQNESWLSKDSKTNTALLLNNVELYFPPQPQFSEPNHLTSRQRYSLSILPRLKERRQRRTRVIVNITEPMLPLLKLAAETVAKRLHTQADISSLQIPTRFKEIVSSLLSNP